LIWVESMPVRPQFVLVHRSWRKRRSSDAFF
jgi:hypothetical protein